MNCKECSTELELISMYYGGGKITEYFYCKTCKKNVEITKELDKSGPSRDKGAGRRGEKE